MTDLGYELTPRMAQESFVNSVEENEVSNELYYKNHIQLKMWTELYFALTQGRIDEELEPLSGKAIAKFIYDNSSAIQLAVDKMYEEFRNEDNLEDLINGENDWYREWLYDEITIG